MKLLTKNPFTMKERAHDLFAERLTEWCKENRFKYVLYEGKGSDNGYEPKVRNNWY